MYKSNQTYLFQGNIIPGYMVKHAFDYYKDIYNNNQINIIKLKQFNDLLYRSGNLKLLYAFLIVLRDYHDNNPILIESIQKTKKLLLTEFQDQTNNNAKSTLINHNPLIQDTNNVSIEMNGDILDINGYTKQTKHSNSYNCDIMANEIMVDDIPIFDEDSNQFDGIPIKVFLNNIQKQQDFVGCYIIYNKSKFMYYVGQAKNVLKRLPQHFTGRGNQDIYADYKYGDNFLVKVIRLIDYGCDNIDQMERELIEKYNAYKNGYNGNRGNIH